MIQTSLKREAGLKGERGLKREVDLKKVNGKREWEFKERGRTKENKVVN